MADLTLRHLANRTGIVYDPAKLTRIFAEDWTALIEALVDHASAIDTQALKIGGDRCIDMGRKGYLKYLKLEPGNAGSGEYLEFKDFGSIAGDHPTIDGSTLEFDNDVIFNGTVSGPFITAHNSLTGLQGGSASERYHLDQTEHDNLTDGSDAGSLHVHDSRYYPTGSIDSLIANTLKRSADDFATFSEKTSLDDDDVFVIEDSADSKTKKRMKGSTIKASLTSIFPATTTGLFAASQNAYVNYDNSSATEANVQIPGIASTLKIFRVALYSVASDITFTVRKNGVDTALTLTVPSASANGIYEISADVAILDTDLISVHLVTGTGSGTGVSGSWIGYSE